MKTAFLSVLLSLSAAPAIASEYPADAGYLVDSQTNGSVKVSRVVQYGTQALALNLEYTGFLLEDTTGPLTALFIVHYQDGDRQIRVPMTRQGYTVATARVTDGCLVGMLGGCETLGTEEMKNFLYWAHAGSKQNALKLEIAIDAGYGDWDSNSDHGNYKLEFPEK